MDGKLMLEVLEKSYSAVAKGLPGVDSVQVSAEKYLSKYDSVENAAKAMIDSQVLKCSASGFLTSLGGLVTLPVTLPANIASVLIMQLRMIVTLAYMGGYDIESDEVKTLSYACLLGNAMAEPLKEAGVQMSIQAATKVTSSLLAKTSDRTIALISNKAMTSVNKSIATKLAAKLGTKGMAGLSKAVPLLGGVVGGTMDLVSTKIVAKVAYDKFIKK